ncbi:MAG: hypothetical protein ABL921_17305 [Pirellula sp.]
MKSTNANGAGSHWPPLSWVTNLTSKCSYRDTLLIIGTAEGEIISIGKQIEKSASPKDRLSQRNRTTLVLKKKDWSDLQAWLASCLFHTLLLITLGFLWKPAVRGTGGEIDRPVGIVVGHETSMGDDFFLAGGGSDTEDPATEMMGGLATALRSNESAGPPLSVDSLISELIGSNNGVSKEGTAVTKSGLSGDGNSIGSGIGSQVGSGTKTKMSFFGVEGTGSSFVYVVDRSDSMNAYDSAPLIAAKRELKKSLESFKEYHQFQIVFYNDTLLPLSQERRLLFATDTNKDSAKLFLNAVRGDGGTQHLEAIKYGLSLGPEVLFFLTDAEDPRLTESQLLDIQRRAEHALTTLNAIQFNVGAAVGDGGWIRRLAEMNRGHYLYVDVTSLSARR